MFLPRPLLSFMSILPTLFHFTSVRGQNVSPIIAEYTSKAVGSFEVTNSSLVPSVVILESKSFKINEDGEGEFRDLDSEIHVELSVTSIRLEPKQSARIFYKVVADKLPAWLCIYASFSPVKKREGINIRMMLPHTIYLYQRQPLQASAIKIGRLRYDRELRRVLCDLENDSESAGRAQSMEITGKHGFATAGGFPMLPHEKRVVTVDWTAPGDPDSINIEFEHFTVKRPIIEMTLEAGQ
jgi:hypothetical protein